MGGYLYSISREQMAGRKRPLSQEKCNAKPHKKLLAFQRRIRNITVEYDTHKEEGRDLEFSSTIVHNAAL